MHRIFNTFNLLRVKFLALYYFSILIFMDYINSQNVRNKASFIIPQETLYTSNKCRTNNNREIEK